METAAKIASEYRFILRKHGEESSPASLAESLIRSDVTDEELLFNLQRIYVTGEAGGFGEGLIKTENGVLA